MKVLKIFHHNELLHEHLLASNTYRLGRGLYESSEENFIRLNNPLLSKEHFEFQLFDDHFSIRDLGSKNGTQYKSSPNRKLSILTHQTVLNYDALIYINNIEFRFSDTNASYAVQDKRIETLADEFLSYTNRGSSSTSLESFLNHKQYPLSEDDKKTLYLEFFGNGPLHDYMSLPHCKEILANSPTHLFIDVGDGLKRIEKKFLTKNTYEAWVHRITLTTGRRVDRQNPICEATLKDGSRLHVVLSPISSRSSCVSIRRFGHFNIDADYALNSGWINSEQLELLQLLIKQHASIIISGGTSAGKTTLLNFLCAFIQQNERVISIEDTFELQLQHQNWVALQTRKANSEGLGEIDMRDLIRSSLRMRPDRIIVGECRGKETLELIQALNTGHPGSLSTLHANSAEDAYVRLETLLLLYAKNLEAKYVNRWIESGVDAFIHVSRNDSGERTLSEIIIHERFLKKTLNISRSSFNLKNSNLTHYLKVSL